MKTHPGLLALTFTAITRADVKFGFAERDVAPEAGMEVPGFYHKVFVKTIHDPCKVRVSVFDDGKNRCAIVGIDALSVRRDTVQEARRRITEKCGIRDTLLGMAREFKPAPLPQRPAHAPWKPGSPGFGSVPPQHKQLFQSP